MTHSQLLEELKKVDIEEIRADTTEKFEFALRTDYLTQLNGILQRYFGPPLKPPNERPSRQAAYYASSYGGIRRGQTLYCREGETVFDFALLWPWGDGTYVTVKILQDEKSKFDTPPEGLWQKISRILFGRKE